jgi:ABC-type transporter Mla subunit MlaD
MALTAGAARGAVLVAVFLGVALLVLLAVGLALTAQGESDSILYKCQYTHPQERYNLLYLRLDAG